MANLIIAIVIYLIALLLASLSFFTDKSGKKTGKIIILIIVIIAAIGGGWIEVSKYNENNELNTKFSKLFVADSLRGIRYDSLKTDYDSLRNSFKNLSNSYSAIKTAITKSKFTYDSIGGRIINNNNGQIKGNVKNANLGTMNGGHIGDDNFGIVPRKFKDADIMSLMNRFYPDKNIKIYFLSYEGADAEVTSVKEQIIGILNKNGYKNIDKAFRPNIGFTPPANVELDSVLNENAVQIKIPTAK